MPGGPLSVSLGAGPLQDFDPLTDFDMTGSDDVWFARPQLFFSCSLCPTGQMEDKASHMEVSLVFFSTFEPISLTPDSCMQRNGIPMLYELAASQLPTRLPCGKRSRQCSADSMLPQREPSQHCSSFFASSSSCWCCSRFQARQRDRQQAF